MKIFLISNNKDTRTGLRIVGIDGVIVNDLEELKKELDKAILDKSIGIILIVEELAKEFPDVIRSIKLERKLPLIVEIPDRHGTKRSADFISSYVREAIGIKM